MSDGTAAWRSLHWALSLIMDRVRDDLRPHGLSIEELDVLSHLSEARGQIAPLADLAGSMVFAGALTRSGLTRLIDRMEARGLVERRLSATDRRRFDVALTAEGRGTFNAAWPDHERGIATYFSEPLSRSDISSMTRVAAKLISANDGKAGRAL